MDSASFLPRVLVAVGYQGGRRCHKDHSPAFASWRLTRLHLGFVNVLMGWDHANNKMSIKQNYICDVQQWIPPFGLLEMNYRSIWQIRLLQNSTQTRLKRYFDYYWVYPYRYRVMLTMFVWCKGGWGLSWLTSSSPKLTEGGVKKRDFSSG